MDQKTEFALMLIQGQILLKVLNPEYDEDGNLIVNPGLQVTAAVGDGYEVVDMQLVMMAPPEDDGEIEEVEAE